MSQDRSDIKHEGMDELKGLWSFSDDDSGYNETGSGRYATSSRGSTPSSNGCLSDGSSSDCSSHRSTPPIAEELDFLVDQQHKAGVPPMSSTSPLPSSSSKSNTSSVSTKKSEQNPGDVIDQDGGWLCSIIGSSDIGNFTDAYNSFNHSDKTSSTPAAPSSASSAPLSRATTPRLDALPTSKQNNLIPQQQQQQQRGNEATKQHYYYQQQQYNNQVFNGGRPAQAAHQQPPQQPAAAANNSAPLLNGNENLTDALGKIIRIAGNRLPEASFSGRSGNGSSHLDLMIKECNTIENLLWHQVYNVIKDELKFKQSPFFNVNQHGSGAAAGAPHPGTATGLPLPPPPMMPPQCLLPPPPPPPPALGPMHPHHHHQLAQHPQQGRQILPPSNQNAGWTAAAAAAQTAAAAESLYSRPKISSKTQQFQQDHGRYQQHIPRWA